MKISGLVRCAGGEYALSGCRARGVRVVFGASVGIRRGPWEDGFGSGWSLL